MNARTLSLLVALSLTPSVARAQNPTPSELAEEHFQRGRSLEDNGRAAEAVAEYRQALRLEETPAGYVRLGGTLRSLGRYRDGITALERALTLASADPEGYRALTRAATATLRDLRESLAYWSITANAPDVRVSFDGEILRSTTRWHEADPGTHVLVVQSPGRAPITRTLTLSAGVHEEIPVELVPSDGGVSTAPSRSITQSPWFWLGAAAVTAGIVVGAVLLLSTTEDEFHGTFYGTVPSGIMLRP